MENGICYQKKKNRALRGFFQPQTKNLCIRHHHRGFSPLGSQWKDWLRWQKLCSRVEIKRIAWSELGMSSRPCKARKFLLLTHSGQVKGFPWQVLLTHLSPQLSFRKGVVLSSHRAGLNCFPSSGACSEVPAPPPLHSITQHHCRVQRDLQSYPQLLVRAGQTAMNLASITPVPWSSKGKRGNSRNSSSQPGAAFRTMSWEGFSWPKPHLQWWWGLVPV